MTKDEIIKLAREAGMHDPMIFIAAYERFARLVAEREREECAKVVEPDAEHRRDASCGYLGGAEGIELLDNIAEVIRARGNA